MLRPGLAASLKTLKLSGMLETLDARLAQAHGGGLGHLEFLQIPVRRRDQPPRSPEHAPPTAPPPRTPGLVRTIPHPVVAESLLDRLINTSHQVFMNGPSYRPNKRPKTNTPAAE